MGCPFENNNVYGVAKRNIFCILKIRYIIDILKKKRHNFFIVIDVEREKVKALSSSGRTHSAQLIGWIRVTTAF